MKSLRFSLLLIGFCAGFAVAGQPVVFNNLIAVSALWATQNVPVVINEFMASNTNSVRDPQGEYEDWIEIYNYGSVQVDISGMYLTDDLSEPTKWQLPTPTVITGVGYLLIWADDDIDDPGLHANFKLSAAGEEIGLFDTDGVTLIDSVTFGEQNTNISTGRFPDADDNWHIYPDPTPESENTGGLLGQVQTPSFSHTRGFYETPFYVTIATETSGTEIYYTLDGSSPFDDELNVPTGTYLTGPVSITDTSTLRAVAIKPGYKPSRVASHTYIFIDNVTRQPADPSGWPSDWGWEYERGWYWYINEILPADYEMDPRVVNNTLPGYSIRDALLDIPTVSISMFLEDFVTDHEDNGIYSNPVYREEQGWTRKCSVEYFLPDGSEGFQEDCEIKIHGNASRYPQRMHKHSLRLTFTSRYGAAKLRYPLFPESNVDEFNQLILKAFFTDSWALVSWDSGRYRPNDSQYIRDAWMKESLRDMGQPSSYGRFVHLYVNGLYFGLHNLSERVDEDFLADHFGGEPDDWELNADFSSPRAHWNAMMSIDPSTSAGYQEMQEYLDVENYIDYMLLHFYGDSEDWPHHNGHAAANPVSGDGKFRFFVWDQEIVLDNHGLSASRINRTGGAGDIFQLMRTSDQFKLLFADRVYKHCFNDGALSVTASQNRYLKIANIIDKAIVAESARWGDVQMSVPYANSIQQPSPLTNINHYNYPPAPHGPDYYFTREDSWVVERDNVINNYIPAIHDTANSDALINILRAADLYPDIDPPAYSINDSYQHGGYINTGDRLTMTNPNNSGTIYYTLDGTNPVLPGTPPEQIIDETIVTENASKRVLIPTGQISDEWKGGGTFDDSGWTSVTGSPGGVGYERGSGYQNYISFDVESQMYNRQPGCYIRIPFNIAEVPETIDILILRIRYDDGFIAYINGVEVHRETVSGTPDWDSFATGNHEAGGLDSFNISEHIGSLRQGDNILAIHALNVSLGSSDFIISAELASGYETGGTDAQISDSAIEYTQPIILTNNTHIKARVLDDGTLSALNEALYAVEQVNESLRITEIMYHPQSQADANDPNEEFIELTNIGSETINLDMVKFTNGIDFTFPSLELIPGEYVVVVEDIDAFEARYGTDVYIAGQYTGRLANNSERIRLEDALGQTILDFRYDDDWFDSTDGQGLSLTIRNPANLDPNSWNQKSSWRPSAYSGGSPGMDDNNF